MSPLLMTSQTGIPFKLSEKFNLFFLPADKFFVIFISFCHRNVFISFQLLSIEDVEKIMDETAAGIEYQRVRFFLQIYY